MTPLRLPVLRAGLARRIAVVNIVALLPLALLALLQTEALIGEAEGNLSQAAAGRTLQAAQLEINTINSAQTLAQTLAALLPGHAGTDADCVAMVTAAERTDPKFSLVGYVPASGRLTCASRPLTLDLSQVPQIMAADGPGLHLASGGLAARGTRTLVATHPVYGPDGMVAGKVIVTVPHIGPELPDGPARHGLREKPVALITFDREGQILTSSLGLDFPVQPLPAGRSLEGIARQGQQTFTAVSRAGIQRVFAVVPITGDIFLIGTWEIEAEWTTLPPHVGPYLLAALMGLSGLVAAIFAAERLVVGHIRSLGQSMGAFARGRRDIAAPELDDPPNEIGELADNYTAMVETILHEEAVLENLLREKEYLLREVHHRTGNSLQLIASILRMHLRETTDPDVRLILEHLYGRVVGLSTVHLGLYRLAGSTNVAMDALLADVIKKVDQIHGRGREANRIGAELAPLMLSTPQAVPLALLLSEVLSAFLETDFAVGDDVPVTVGLEILAGNTARLSLTGNTAALPRMSGAGAPAAIAARLIRGFVRQLEGEMTLGEDEDDGLLRFTTTFIIRQPTMLTEHPPEESAQDTQSGTGEPPAPMGVVPVSN